MHASTFENTAPTRLVARTCGSASTFVVWHIMHGPRIFDFGYDEVGLRISGL